MNAVLRRKLASNLPYGLALMGLMVLALAAFSILLRDDRTTRPAIDAPPLLHTETDRQIERLQERLEALPADASGYVNLGGAFLQKARETGDPSYYARAEEALTHALELSPDSASSMTTMGVVALGRHQFQEAMDWAQRSLALNPKIADAYGVLGDAQVELGLYEAAFETYQAMVDFKPDLGSYARVSYARKLLGDVDGAIEAMRMAVGAGAPGTEAMAWARVQLGELYFDSGRVDEAARHYEAALEDFSGYYLALARLGEARAAQGRHDEAIRLYERAAAIIPQPFILSALGDLYAKTGDADKAQLQYDTVEFIGRLHALNQVIYNRELALFYADHDLKPEQAVALTRNELEVRKDIYGYDALAWALYKSGRFEESAAPMAEAMKLGAQDSSLYYHAGMIFYGLGEMEQARSHLQKALALNPHFSILQADVASRALNEIEGALASLGGPEGSAR